MTTTQKIAFITGGNRGIGLQTAHDLGKQGVTIVLGARNPGSAEAAVVELRQAGITAEAIEYDSAKAGTHRAVFNHLEKKYGHLDILVNNAGTLDEPLGGNTSKDLPIAKLRETFETNFFGVVGLTQTLLPLLEKAPAGRIVNVSSILGSLGLHSAKDSPIAGSKAFAYNASKTALNAFTVHLADALKDTAIKVNSAHPGWVKTELGGPAATDALEGSGQTSAFLATLPEDGPTAGFFHKEERLPW